MGPKRIERIQSIFWGIVFGAIGVAGLCVVAVSSHDRWTAGDWAWVVVILLILFAASAGSFLPDLSVKRAEGWRGESTEVHLEIDGFTTTYDQNVYLAPAVRSLAQMDPGPAHTLFHTSRAGAWGLRFVLIRLLYDRYVGSWAPLAVDSMLDSLVERTKGDPCWLLLRGYHHLQRGRVGRAMSDLRLASARDPEDPTPFVLELFGARTQTNRLHARSTAGVAYAEALRRAPSLHEAHEQMAHVLAGDGTTGFDELFAHARSVARGAAEGSDEAFLPALAYGIAHALVVERAGAAAGRALLAEVGVADEIALACRRSFDSPRYRITHRTARMLHLAAALHSVLGDVRRLHGELVRAGNTFDLDVWSPFHDTYPARAFLEARTLARLS